MSNSGRKHAGMAVWLFGSIATLAALSSAAFGVERRQWPSDSWPFPSSNNDAIPPLQTEKLPEALVPITPRSPDEQSRIDALSWFMTGQLKQRRNDNEGALDAYRKAVELDPGSVAIYRELVPLAFVIGKSEEALKYALKAVELDPDDYELLQQLAIQMAVEGRPTEAIEMLEKALNSSTLSKESIDYVTINRHLGVIHSKLGNPKQAADYFVVVFDALQNPKKYALDFRTRARILGDEDTSYEHIGQTFLEAERFDLAVKAFEQAAADRRGKPGNLSYNLAQVYFQTGRQDEALTELQKYFDAQLQSKGRSAYELLAKILEKTEKSSELIPRLEKLSEADRHNTVLQFFLAEQYLAGDQLDKAESLFKSTIGSSGGTEGHIGLASVYRRQKKPAELLESLAKAAQGGRDLERLNTEMTAISQDAELLDKLMAAGNELAAGDAPQLDFAKAYILGRLAVDAERTPDVLTFYKFALAHRPDPQRAYMIYKDLGDYLMEVRQFEDASKILEEAANDGALRPAKVEFLFRWAHARALAGDTPGALAVISDAQKMKPDAGLLFYEEAWIHFHNKNYDEAIRLFRGVIDKFPGDKEIVRRCQFTLSNLYVQQGNIPEGERILEEIYAAEQDNISVNNDLGYLYADQGKNLEQAEGMIRKALAAEPDNAAYLDSMGWVLFKLGRFEEAVTHLEKAASKPEGQDTTIYDHLGDCLDKLNKPQEAITAWEKALEFGQAATPPDEKVVARIKEKIQNKRETPTTLKSEKSEPQK